MNLYAENTALSPFGTGKVSYEMKCDDLVFRPDVISTPAVSADYIAKAFGIKRNEPLKVTDVMTNGPATIAFFNDGKKSVAVVHDGDKYNERFGLLACLLRKALRNRRWDHLEKLVRKLSKLKSTKDMRALGEMLVMAADWLERDDH